MTASKLLDRLTPAESGRLAEQGRAWLDLHGLPTTKEEAWRHTPVDDIVTAFLDTQAATLPDTVLDPETFDRLVPDLGGPRIVHVNGRVVPALCRLDGLADGLRIGQHGDFDGAGKAGDEPADGFEALNWIAGHDVASVILEADTVADDVDHPLQIVHITDAEAAGPANTHPRTYIEIGDRSRLQIHEFHATTAGASVTNAATRIEVGAGAHLVHRRIVIGNDESVHVGRVDIEQLADSTVSSTAVSIDGAIVRTGIRARLAGDGARVELDGLYVPVERQRHDTVVLVDHAASHGYSNQVFKGVIADRARGSFTGHIVVRPDTVRNDAHQSNPNLILDRSAQAATNPWLEIYADDVACTHGATVGRLDEEALFYLRSRGIPAEQARTVLVSAFAGEIVHHLEPAGLRERIEALLTDRTPGGLSIEP